METITTPDAIDKIAAALAKAQGELTNPKKTKTANLGKYKYAYADLGEIMDAVRPTLAKHGLAIVQTLSPGVLLTMLVHESGQAFRSTYALPEKATAQEMGSAITYGRRYSVSAILGIAAEDDDDGAKAQDAGPVGEESRDTLISLMGEAGIGNKALMDYCRANGLNAGVEPAALRAVADLPEASVRSLVKNWATVQAAIRVAAMPKAPPAPTVVEWKGTHPAKVETKPDHAPTVEAELAPAASPAASALAYPKDTKLVELMKADGVTPEMLKAFYVGAGHLAADIEPADIPAWYAATLLANWSKALQKIKP